MANQIDCSKGYLELSSDFIRFDPVSKVTNVFFDETNKEVLSVRGGGTLGVVVKGKDVPHTFCMENKGTISSIKFSPNHLVLVIQRNSSAVEILSYKEGELSPGCIQEVRTKGAQLLGFIWASPDDLVLISDHAVELYQISKERMTTRFVKSHSQTTKWFVWSPECNLLLLCTQAVPVSATFQPIVLYPGQMTKLGKFEVETSVTLNERDVCLATIYGTTTVCILCHSPSPAHRNQTRLDVISQSKDGAFKKSHICQLESSGKFAVNILDSLVAVHHQSSKTSLLFDICLGGRVTDGITSVFPVTMPKSVCPFSLEEPLTVPSSESIPVSVPCQLYASTWVIFLPDIIIDARLGCMWRLHLRLEALANLVEDKALLVDCLLRRTNAKPLVLSVVKQVIESGMLTQLGLIFDKMNASYRQHLNSIVQSQMGECVHLNCGNIASEVSLDSVFVDQAEIYSNIFAPLMERADKTYESSEKQPHRKETKPGCMINTKLIVGVILNYIRSLDAAGITVQHFLYELVINGLVRTKQFYQLHQLLQYHVLTDSKPLACLLLSLVGVYTAGEQLSLDMLGRLNTAHDEIIEVLLSHKMVTQALRYARSVGLVESISARKFLEAALLTEDEVVFFSTFKFFSLRNASLRGNPSFAKGEHCDLYVEHFKKSFGNPDFSFQPV